MQNDWKEYETFVEISLKNKGKEEHSILMFTKQKRFYTRKTYDLLACVERITVGAEPLAENTGLLNTHKKNQICWEDKFITNCNTIICLCS